MKFKSESDWSQMGVKIDRWEKVDGLHPDGSENKKGVPIRHVERYEVPAIIVEDWIEKYSKFEIPLPPLPVQKEIVRMLDDMAGLRDALEEELAAAKILLGVE